MLKIDSPQINGSPDRERRLVYDARVRRIASIAPSSRFFRNPTGMRAEGNDCIRLLCALGSAFQIKWAATAFNMYAWGLTASTLLCNWNEWMLNVECSHASPGRTTFIHFRMRIALAKAFPSSKINQENADRDFTIWRILDSMGTANHDGIHSHTFFPSINLLLLLFDRERGSPWILIILILNERASST